MQDFKTTEAAIRILAAESNMEVSKEDGLLVSGHYCFSHGDFIDCRRQAALVLIGELRAIRGLLKEGE